MVSHFTPSTSETSVEIERVTVRKELDLETGNLRPSLRGMTRQKIRAIGTEGAYQVFFVELVPATSTKPAATLTGSYGLDGHGLHTSLKIFLPEPALLTLVTEFAALRSPPKRLEVQFRAGGFFGWDGDVLLLPPWSEQQPQKTQESIDVEWHLPIDSIRMDHPPYSREALPVNATLGHEVSVRFANENAVKEQSETVARDLSSIKDALHQLRLPLYLLIAVLVVLAYFASRYH